MIYIHLLYDVYCTVLYSSVSYSLLYIYMPVARLLSERSFYIHADFISIHAFFAHLINDQFKQ